METGNCLTDLQIEKSLTELVNKDDHEPPFTLDYIFFFFFQVASAGFGEK